MYPGPAAALVSYTSLIMTQIAYLRERFDVLRMAMADPKSGEEPIDKALIDPEYQVEDAVTIASQNFTFPFIMLPQSCALLSSYFDASFMDKLNEELYYEIGQFLVE